MVKKKYLPGFILVCISILFSITSNAQLISSNPSFPKASDSVTITFDASLGNKGLMNYTGDVYAHAGVITQESTSTTDWKHAPSWGDNSVKYKLKRVSANIYELKIKPSIREYYGLTAGEQVRRLAFVFRSADNSKEGKTESGGDIFYDILNVAFQKPEQRPAFPRLNDTIIIEAKANTADSIFIYLDNLEIKSDTGNIVDTNIFVEEYGKHWVKTIAYSEGAIMTDSFFYFVKKPDVIAEVPAGVQNGLNFKNDSTVILSFVAPGKKTAFIIGEFNNWQTDTSFQMNLTSDGNRFWIELGKLKAGTEYAYQYIVDGKTIADPYARKVLDPWNDSNISSSVYPNLKKYPTGMTSGIVSVLTTTPSQYTWKHDDYEIPAKEDLVVYELLVRDFSASHSFQGVIDSLNYLKNLGFNALELMPVMEFEGNSSWGYNPSFYFAVDKYYGTPEKFKQLVDTCHSLGIVVILDIVLNHSFGQSPMVQMYWDNATGAPAANSPWYNVIAKHDYNVGYDFNHDSELTKSFTTEVIKHWLQEYKIDGYRFDLSKGFTQKNTLGNVGAWGAYDANRIALWKSYADSIWNYNPEAIVILEHFADNSEEKELVDYGMMVWGNANHAYTEGAMGYNENNKSDFSWGSYKARGMSKPGLVTYMESHDEERMGFKNKTYGSTTNPDYSVKELNNSLQRSELAAALFFTIPGAKMVWQFGELGYDFSIDQNGRTGEKPIPWNYYNIPQRKRLYDVYSALIDLKKEPAFSSSDFTQNVAGAVKYVSVNLADMDVRVVGNFSVQPAEASMNFSKTGWWYDYFSGDSIEVSELQTSIPLNISEYKIYTTKRLTKPDVLTSIENNYPGDNKLKGVSVFPNPCSDILNVRTNSQSAIQLEVNDLSGRIVLSEAIQGNSRINTSRLKEGVYIVKMKQGNKVSDLKLFIVR